MTATASNSKTLEYACPESSFSASSSLSSSISLSSNSPLSSSSSLSGSSTPTMALSSHTYTPGWCGVHVTQYHRNESSDNPRSDFKFDFRIYDGAEALLATFMGADIPSGLTLSIVAPLPTVFNVTAKGTDDDPVLFEYNGASWSSDNTRHCKFGGYSETHREGDCGFTC